MQLPAPELVIIGYLDVVWLLWLKSRDVIVQELLEEVIAAACTSPAYKDHCKARDPCVEHLGYLHCTYFGSNLVVPFQYNNSAVRRGWFQSGPGEAIHMGMSIHIG